MSGIGRPRLVMQRNSQCNMVSCNKFGQIEKIVCRKHRVQREIGSGDNIVTVAC